MSKKSSPLEFSEMRAVMELKKVVSWLAKNDSKMSASDLYIHLDVNYGNVQYVDVSLLNNLFGRKMIRRMEVDVVTYFICIEL